MAKVSQSIRDCIFAACLVGGRLWGDGMGSHTHFQIPAEWHLILRDRTSSLMVARQSFALRRLTRLRFQSETALTFSLKLMANANLLFLMPS